MSEGSGTTHLIRIKPDDLRRGETYCGLKVWSREKSTKFVTYSGTIVQAVEESSGCDCSRCKSVFAGTIK